MRNYLVSSQDIELLKQFNVLLSDSRINIEHIEDADILFAHKILDCDPFTSVSTLYIVKNLYESPVLDLIVRACQTNTFQILSNRFNHSPFVLISNFHKTRVILPNLGSGTGLFKHGVMLFVGERPGKPESLGKKDAAFFSQEHSSKWLRQQIGLCPNSYWINAFDRQNVETDWSFVSQLKPSLVVAIGGVASESLEKAKIEHVKVAHPSYWKRYRSKEPYPLCDIIKQHQAGSSLT